jgi:hypothetical protein
VRPQARRHIHTSTSTWWAPVNLVTVLGLVYQGADRASGSAIRAISSCREAPVRRVFENGVCTLAPRLLARAVRYFLSKTMYPSNTSMVMERDLCLGRGGYGRVFGERRPSELAADNREAMPGKSARWRMTSDSDIDLPLGARHNAKHAIGESQPEKRHGLAAEVLRIDRRRRNPGRRVFGYDICTHNLYVTLTLSIYYDSPPSWYPTIDRSSIFARKASPLTPQTDGRGCGCIHRDYICVEDLRRLAGDIRKN